MTSGLTAGALAGSLALACAMGLPQPAAAQAEPAASLTVDYTADVAGALSGGRSRAGRALDNLDVIADVDLQKSLGWRGARAHGYLLFNNGGAPNEIAGTLEGIDNIEVSRPGARLYEAWLEQELGGGAALLAGLYDLNSEFYATDASGLLIAPPFGIGSELAATGANGPSIFPSTALAVRLKVASETAYLQLAAFNAVAAAPGDPGGVDTAVDEGLLVIGQAGRSAGPWTLALGAWRYTEDQDDLHDLTPLGDPARRTAQGAYLLAERAVSLGGRDATMFLRAGLSDGDTSPFRGSWQGGLLVEAPLAGRPDGAFSIGLHQAVLGDKYVAAAAEDLAQAETGLEITYADRLTPWLAVQPDLQVIWNPGGLADADPAVVGALRVTVSFSGP